MDLKAVKVGRKYVVGVIYCMVEFYETAVLNNGGNISVGDVENLPSPKTISQRLCNLIDMSSCSTSPGGSNVEDIGLD